MVAVGVKGKGHGRGCINAQAGTNGGITVATSIVFTVYQRLVQQKRFRVIRVAGGHKQRGLCFKTVGIFRLCSGVRKYQGILPNI